MKAVGFSFLLTGPVMLAYGLFDLFTPWLTVRWQVRATRKGQALTRSVGEMFQRVYGVDPDSEPWNDPRLRRRVRWTGGILVLLGALVTTGGLFLVLPA
jgi:hypothetical protein